jgi:hypothetical protein
LATGHVKLGRDRLPVAITLSKTKKLTFKFQGLDQRLTGVEEEAQVIRGILS